MRWKIPTVALALLLGVLGFWRLGNNGATHPVKTSPSAQGREPTAERAQLRRAAAQPDAPALGSITANPGHEPRIRGQVEAVLRAQPGRSRLHLITCSDDTCRVELDVEDLSLYERFQEPESGLPELAGFLQLEQPLPLADGGPWRVAFTLRELK